MIAEIKDRLAHEVRETRLLASVLYSCSSSWELAVQEWDEMKKFYFKLPRRVAGKGSTELEKEFILFYRQNKSLQSRLQAMERKLREMQDKLNSEPQLNVECPGTHLNRSEGNIWKFRKVFALSDGVSAGSGSM